MIDGLRYLPGDADGDGVDQGSENFTQLFNGGEIVGFEVFSSHASCERYHSCSLYDGTRIYQPGSVR